MVKVNRTNLKCQACIDQDTYDKECEWVGNDEACPKADKFWEDYDRRR